MSLLAGHTANHLVSTAGGGLIFLSSLVILLNAVDAPQYKARIGPSVAGALAGVGSMLFNFLVDVPSRMNAVALPLLGVAQGVLALYFGIGMYLAMQRRPETQTPQPANGVATPDVWPPPPTPPQT